MKEERYKRIFKEAESAVPTFVQSKLSQIFNDVFGVELGQLRVQDSTVDESKSGNFMTGIVLTRSWKCRFTDGKNSVDIGEISSYMSGSFQIPKIESKCSILLTSPGLDPEEFNTKGTFFEFLRRGTEE